MPDAGLRAVVEPSRGAGQSSARPPGAVILRSRLPREPLLFCQSVAVDVRVYELAEVFQPREEPEVLVRAVPFVESSNLEIARALIAHTLTRNDI